MQPHVHLVGDVAQIPPAAGGAAVVHLERLDDAGLVHLDRLGVLAADVQNGGGARVHHVGAQAVAEDLGADMLLGKGQARAAVAGAHHVSLLHRHVEHALDRRADRMVALRDSGQHAEGALQAAQHRAVGVRIDAVLDLDDRTVEEVEQHVVAHAGFLGDGFAYREVAAAGDVAEEVGLALGAGREQPGRFHAQPPEDFLEGTAHALGGIAEVRAGQALAAGGFEIGELLDELFEAKVPFELLDESAQLAVQGAGLPQRLAEQVEARVDQRLLLRHLRGGVVVGARVGDAAPEHVAVLVDAPPPWWWSIRDLCR